MTVISATTEALDVRTRAEIICVCVAAHGEPDFERLFSYIPSGGRHFIAYESDTLVRWAVRQVSTAEGHDGSVATLPHAIRGTR